MRLVMELLFAVVIYAFAYQIGSSRQEVKSNVRCVAELNTEQKECTKQLDATVSQCNIALKGLDETWKGRMTAFEANVEKMVTRAWARASK